MQKNRLLFGQLLHRGGFKFPSILRYEFDPAALAFPVVQDAIPVRAYCSEVFHLPATT